MPTRTITPDRGEDLMPADLKQIDDVRRPIEDEVALDAPPDLVWRALTDAKELARWFPLEAAVTPGVGGKISLSWGPLGSEETLIEIWEPNRRLRTVQRRRDAAGRRVEIALDYVIESGHGRTVLRVVNSGFGRGADWEDEYDGTIRGWRYELRGLRHYLRHHAGTDRRVAVAEVATGLSPEAAYRRIVGPGGLGGGAFLAPLQEGDAYRLDGAGSTFAGRILVNGPPLDFAGTVSNLNEGLLRYELYCGKAKLWVATWGVAQSRVSRLENAFRTIVATAQ